MLQARAVDDPEDEDGQHSGVKTPDRVERLGMGESGQEDGDEDQASEHLHGLVIDG